MNSIELRQRFKDPSSGDSSNYCCLSTTTNPTNASTVTIAEELFTIHPEPGSSLASAMGERIPSSGMHRISSQQAAHKSILQTISSMLTNASSTYGLDASNKDSELQSLNELDNGKLRLVGDSGTCHFNPSQIQNRTMSKFRCVRFVFVRLSLSVRSWSARTAWSNASSEVQNRILSQFLLGLL